MDQESWTVEFDPPLVADVASVSDGVAKIVGESEDYDSAPKAEDVVHEEFDRHPSRRQQRVSGQIPFGQVRHRFQ